MPFTDLRRNGLWFRTRSVARLVSNKGYTNVGVVVSDDCVLHMSIEGGKEGKHGDVKVGRLPRGQRTQRQPSPQARGEVQYRHVAAMARQADQAPVHHHAVAPQPLLEALELLGVLIRQ